MSEINLQILNPPTIVLTQPGATVIDTQKGVDIPSFRSSGEPLQPGDRFFFQPSLQWFLYSGYYWISEQIEEFRYSKEGDTTEIFNPPQLTVDTNFDLLLVSFECSGIVKDPCDNFNNFGVYLVTVSEGFSAYEGVLYLYPGNPFKPSRFTMQLGYHRAIFAMGIKSFKLVIFKNGSPGEINGFSAAIKYRKVLGHDFI